MRFKKQTWIYKTPIYVQSTGTVVGPKEAEGPLRESYDKYYEKLYCGEETWELAERKLMKEAIEISLEKAGRKIEEIDFFIAGDLLNQMVTSNYIAKDLPIPYLGVFSACATSMEAMATGALLLDGDYADSVLVATSSHHSTAERQFRYPTEFAVQRSETSSFTVTGAGASLISKEKNHIRLHSATIGKVIDYEIKNPFQFGAAMAPAAVDTMKTHLQNTNTTVEDYDLIVTGDLARVGSGILHKLLEDEGITLPKNYDDCGVMIYAPGQNVFSGGSGAACCAVVTFGHLFNEMKKGKFKRLLVVATGALLNPFMIYQKESIPCIAHAVSFQLEG
ncbi:stage V sporulation protein AD [Alkalihalobacillus alcalophilus ATCC 27647 = CGMCC 1.3604]|uniref:Stage V sporulation protein AD n=1 Tax=Alkalihalobacillus alcalophilus ATCC 27647 = CGMCC 1.3604 TaxID=1218173 RepID=A0A094WLH3_ALKAL|nr:stage V sporulation protein AD [Alkalihalobacillus alcalophilus]KGA98609.1 stage V sporulation protein AD [Alkalihalobacillus alcalophilus ATCC 27647 = CGMCC 1.3604]MED1560452.1 stage V sporulation protein AD [Alkalihalobacillus alcalophilus]THG90900.1 stage V sporulation protein AD [Alkalihalobacillus alcalophilus ATCC 27647 = CGMCC 1.3604]